MANVKKKGDVNDANNYENDHVIEVSWAIKAYEHAEVYFNLITSLDPNTLRLCPQENDIYEKFRSQFPDFNVDKIVEAKLKSPSAKEVWRKFCNEFDQMRDFNYGTLIRIDCTGGYNDKNTIFGTRIQFLAIEIARNREGYNTTIYKEACNKKAADEKS